MSDQSPEATVAGEAASKAVDELHSREAVVEAAAMSEVEAGMAAEEAQVASQEAEAAAQTSSVAVAVAAEADDKATEAQDVSAATLSELRAMRAEMGEVRGFVGELYQERQAAKEATESNAVEEVPVNDTAARESASGSDNETPATGQGSTAAPGTSDKPTSDTKAKGRSNGLRRRNR